MSAAVPQSGPGTATTSRRGPYQGLIPYSEQDAAWFFGRDRTRAIILDNLLAYRMSVLYGPSGVGKSSLLRAGVVRHVRDDGRRRIEAGDSAEHAALAYSTWAHEPVAGLKAAIRDALEQLSPTLGAELPEGSLADLVSAAAQQLDGTLLIILDQFEEYFLYHTPDSPFIDELTSMLSRREAAASVLISIREDALASLDALTGRLPSLLDNLVRVDHLDRAAARAAIEQPLQLWNSELAAPGEQVSIEPALIDAVLDGVQTTSVDAPAADGGGTATGARVQTPYLQLVLVRLWEEEQRAGSRVMRLQTLERLNGAEQIVALHVDTAIAKMTVAEQAVAAKVLRQLVTPSGSKIALRSADLAEYAALDEATVVAVLERLTREARILQAIGDSRYEIYHDALARPILEWRRRWQADQDRARARRRNRIAAAIGGGLLLTVVVVTALAVVAIGGRNEARRLAADATSVALASAAGDQVGAAPDIALLLALGALDAKDRPEARRSMLAARAAAGYGAALGIMRGHSETVNAVAFAARGRLLASAGDDGRILLWDPSTHRRRGPPITVKGAIWSLAVSVDGRRLAAGADDGTIRVWDIGSRRRLATLRHGSFDIKGLAFSPDGRRLASASEGLVRLWDTRALGMRGASVDLPVPAEALAFSPDGRTLAYSGVMSQSTGGPQSYRATVGLLDIASQRPLGRPFVRRVELDTVAFSRDGRLLAIGGEETWLWDLASGRRRRVPGAAGALALSVDGKRLATAGKDGNVRIFDVATRRRLSEPLTGPAQGLHAIAFSPDGATLAAAGEDKRVWLFDSRFPRLLGSKVNQLCTDRDAGGALVAVEGADPCTRFDAVAIGPAGRVLASPGSDGGVRLLNARSLRRAAPPLLARDDDAVISSLTFSRDGRLLTAATDSGPVRVWDRRTRRVVSTLPNPAASTDIIAVSPDGRVLATPGEDDVGIVLRDVRSRRPLRGPPRELAPDIASVAFSPDGRILAWGGQNGRIRLWNLVTHRPIGASPVANSASAGAWAVTFSPDGETLASAGDQTISLWDVSGLRLRGRVSSRQESLASLAFTPDGRVLIAGGASGIELIDPAATRAIGTLLRGEGFEVKQIAASPDGTLFASAHGPQLRVWRHILWQDRNELQREICSLVGSGLSRSEWTQLAPGVPYRALCER